MTKILLVDDDIELAGMLGEYLEREGFQVWAVQDGRKAAEMALGENFDLVVLDVMMPGLNGIEVLRAIRRESRLPVLMLTAKGDDEDRIVGLELGADDYVPKPCRPRELAARIRAILRRAQATPGTGPECHRVGALAVWPARRQAEWDGKALELTSTEFNLLEVLARHAGRVVSKAELTENALGRRLARFDRSVDVHMSSLRHKLGTLPDGRSCIHTVRGMGYQLIKE
ncbi:MAG TPA: response regulator transcription factor [Thiobacillaceae bacterium]|nr:response regulator transcription factor [Thiobacillaceae bacterium]HNA82761.1 response regulator transcription factor [Thiobacillaceae bacterium]HNF89052.1 response regulator transcription factor [Thiobacillaceae bacterium]HNH89203.1 response regulator transcription factor [Thiobacillaceae bacterium]HNI07400.1 response regulator transcription factor [Thiobacillaceae bacterium]